MRCCWRWRLLWRPGCIRLGGRPRRLLRGIYVRSKGWGAWRRVAWLLGAFVSVAGAAGPLPGVGRFGGEATGGGVAQVLEPRVFEFPRDHGAHPEYRQEWWYVTGNLDSATGERFGFELT